MGWVDESALSYFWQKVKAYVASHSSGGASLDAVYPVGSVYISVNDTDPGTLFGGTWEQFATGRTLVGVDSTDTDFSVGNTGGEKTHTLTETELPAHAHDVDAVSITSSGAHIHTAKSNVWVSQDTKNLSSGKSTGRTTTTDIMNSGGAHTHTVPAHTTKSTGSGNSHNNMPPYIAVYMWRRKE